MSAPAIRECLDFAVANGEGLDTCNAAALQLRELLRRDWAVRVLDAFAARAAGRWDMHDLNPDCTPTVRLFPTPYTPDATTHTRGNPDAARLAAAEAVWPELPESVRAELGARP